jgi:hypothetical protein
MDISLDKLPGRRSRLAALTLHMPFEMRYGYSCDTFRTAIPCDSGGKDPGIALLISLPGQ